MSEAFPGELALKQYEQDRAAGRVPMDPFYAGRQHTWQPTRDRITADSSRRGPSGHAQRALPAGVRDLPGAPPAAYAEAQRRGIPAHGLPLP